LHGQFSGSPKTKGILHIFRANDFDTTSSGVQAAQAGLDQATKDSLVACLAEGDELILTASDNSAIKAALALSEHMPFASVNALAFNPNQLEREYRRL